MNYGQTRLFGLIRNANLNANGESALEQYRNWRDNPSYNAGESWLDRFARNVNSSHMEILQDEGSGGGLMWGGYGKAINAAGAVEVAEEAATEGSFSIVDWANYPSEIPQPTGPFRLLQGEEYEVARRSANLINQTMRRSNPELYRGLEIHEIHPVKFGGSPTDPANKVAIPRDYHRQIVTPWWNNNMRAINKIP